MSRPPGFITPQVTKDKISASLKGNKNVVSLRQHRLPIKQFIKCPRCGSSNLGVDEDGQYCLCGWHNYGEFPKNMTLLTGLQEERTNRDSRIIAEFHSGKTRRELSKEHHLSRGRITEIIRGARRH